MASFLRQDNMTTTHNTNGNTICVPPQYLKHLKNINNKDTIIAQYNDITIKTELIILCLIGKFQYQILV